MDILGSSVGECALEAVVSEAVLLESVALSSEGGLAALSLGAIAVMEVSLVMGVMLCIVAIRSSGRPPVVRESEIVLIASGRDVSARSRAGI